jgi:hypothetical protein
MAASYKIFSVRLYKIYVLRLVLIEGNEYKNIKMAKYAVTDLD